MPASESDAESDSESESESESDSEGEGSRRSGSGSRERSGRVVGRVAGLTRRPPGPGVRRPGAASVGCVGQAGAGGRSYIRHQLAVVVSGVSQSPKAMACSAVLRASCAAVIGSPGAQ